MKLKRFLSMLVLLMTAATGVWAQEQWDVVWDFTAWSTETVTALKADAAASKLEGWSDVEKAADAEAGADPTDATKDNCFWSCSGTVNADGNLSANGAVIKEFQGLKFNSDYAAQRKLAIAVNYPSTSLGTYHGSAYLNLGGSKQTCFTIPGVKAGSKITIEVESYNTSSARGIGLYKNSYAAENLIGEQFTPKTFEAKTWEIAEDCNVVVYNTNSCHIYTIKVKAPAAAPSSGYTVSMNDGVKDADKWTVKVGEGQAQALPIGGLKGDGSETVTLQYNGRLKVKSVKAVVEAAKPDLLPAVFTVDAGKTVKFSKGNLQATYNGSSWIWGFAEHQWDYIGNAAGNASINGNGTVSANGTVDLFGWVGTSSTWTGAAQYGISNSTVNNNVDGYGNVGGEAQKVGWGATVGAGWRTLTRPEWLYLLSTRETGVTVNSTNHARYTMAIINTDGTAVKGLIIFPDSYAGGSPAGVIWGTINAKSTFETTCTSAGWTALEAAGCVFLPAAGYSEESTVTDAGDGAGYWSSSSSYAASAFGLYFESNYMSIQFGGSRKYGFSVRLVRDAD